MANKATSGERSLVVLQVLVLSSLLYAVVSMGVSPIDTSASALQAECLAVSALALAGGVVVIARSHVAIVRLVFMFVTAAAALMVALSIGWFVAQAN